MADWYEYTMKVVSKSKDALDRLISIMYYEDDEYYTCRRTSVSVSNKFQEDDYFVVMIYGGVAWSCSSWFDRTERFDETIESGSHYITLDILCERLGIAVEVFCEKAGMGFKEHYLCNHIGDVVLNECVDWYPPRSDSEDNDLPELIEADGFDYYCDFETASKIYNADK